VQDHYSVIIRYTQFVSAELIFVTICTHLYLYICDVVGHMKGMMPEKDDAPIIRKSSLMDGGSGLA